MPDMSNGRLGVGRAMTSDPLSDAMTADHRFGWSDQSCRWTLEAKCHVDRVPFAIKPDQSFDVQFLLPIERADWLEVRFATYARVNTPTVICEFWTDDVAPSRRIELPASSIGDGRFCRVAELTEMHGSAIGRLKLTSPDASDENCFAVWVRNAPLRMHHWEKQLAGFRNERFYLYDPVPERSAVVGLVLMPDDTKAIGAIELVAKACPGSTVRIIEASSPREVWPHVRDIDVLFLTAAVSEFDAFVFELHRYGVCTVWVEQAENRLEPSSAGEASRQRGRTTHVGTRRRCCCTLFADGRYQSHLPTGSSHDLRGVTDPPGPEDLRDLVRRRRLPKVVVVAPTPRTFVERRDLLRSCVSQTFPGPLDLVLIGAEREQSAEDRATAMQDRDFTRFRNIQAVADAKELAAHLNSLPSSNDRCLVVLRRSGIWSPDFLAAHLLEHADDADLIVFGQTISGGNTPVHQRKVLKRDFLQDDGFLNVTSANASFPVRLTPIFSGLFDALADDDPVDREARELRCAYDAYCRGLHFRFSAAATVDVCEHKAEDRRKPAASLQELPDFPLVARRWLAQCAAAGTQPKRDERSLRILSYRWHVPHQYELHKLPHKFTLATNIGGLTMIDSWSFDQRPLRPNVTLAPASTIDPRNFDLAILHFDENVLAPILCNGVLPSNWGEPFLWLLGQTDLPKIAICHGTPQFVGQYGADPEPIEQFRIYEQERRRLVDALVDVKVVCNSWQAYREWGFHDSRVIWHGFDPQQFPAGRHDLGVLALAPDRHRPHYRGAWQHEEVVGRLAPEIDVGTARHSGAALEPRNSNAFATANLRAYVDRIGRFSYYLNTTLRSPMPRSRGEAMVTGTIPVSLANHDVERFILNGENGFYSNDPRELGDWINFMHRRSDLKARVSLAARRTAMDVFNHDRFLADWNDLIRDAGL